MAAALCLGLLLMAASSAVEAQSAPPFISTINDTSHVYIYILDVPYDPQTFSESSLLYPVVRGKIAELLAQGGATLKDLDAKDGGGCAELFVQWTGGDIAFLANLFEQAEENGIAIADGFDAVISLQGCDPSSTELPPKSTWSPVTPDGDDMTTYSLFLTKWSSIPGLDDPGSATFKAIETQMQSLLSPYGSVLKDIAFDDNEKGCLEIWIQIEGGDIRDLTQFLGMTLEEKGIELFGKAYNVSSDDCRVYQKNETDARPKSTTLVISGLPWMKEYKDPKSGDFQMLKTAVSEAFGYLNGEVLDLEIMQSGNCVLFNIQWRWKSMKEIEIDPLQFYVEKGLKIKNDVYGVHNSCPMQDYTFCNFFNGNPCGGSGSCMGDPFKEGQFCACNSGFGGLFCENNEPDAMSECDLKRRASLFIHHQVTGEEDQLKSMNTSMRELLSKLMVRKYEVPTCYPPSNVTKDNYYSMCEHDAKTGQKLECQCLSGNGKPNYWHYVAEKDCRVFDKYLPTVKGELYIHNMPWTYDLMEGSELYDSIKSQIDRYMSPAGGYLSELKFSPWGNSECVLLELVYRAERGVTGKTLFYSMPGSSLVVKNENKTLSLFPCKEDIDVNACPKPQPDSFSICLYECGPNDPCQDGLTCCNNSCGMGICKELGYLQKMEASLTMNVTYLSAYEDKDSELYEILEENIMTAIESIMTENQIDGYSSVKVLGFERVKYQPRHRKRRQALEFDNTLIRLEFLFTTEVPVEKLMQVGDQLRENGFVFGSTTFTILYITLGKGDICGCTYDSICVEMLDGQDRCVCPRGRAGSNCELTVCQNPDGSSMCQNNAPCKYDEINNRYRCHCEMGYHGKYCETKVCDQFISDVCDNNGTCVGDIAAMTLCSCPAGTAGLFCENYVEPDYNQTYCERHRAFASYVVGVLNGSRTGSELSGNVSALFPFFNASRNILLLPTCRYDKPDNPGEYHYYCGFDTDTGLESDFQDCLCVNGDGSPNYWTFKDGYCDIYGGEQEKPCDRRPCRNGGVCHNMPDDDFSCSCAPGFHGKTCQDHHRDQCPHGGAPLYKSFGLWTCGTDRPCPIGFYCHGSSFNGSCCFKPDFLCDFKLCSENGGTCIGDLQSGQICRCPPGKAGLLCDKEDDGVKLTQCQKQQQLRSWLLKLVQTGNTPGESTLSDFRQILIHIGVTHIPKDSCDEDGEFKTKVKSVSVLNPNDEIDLCFDGYGVYDHMCKDEVCDKVKDFGICMNGGDCIGDLSRGLCDCTGTGYHGAVCEKPGPELNGTDCTRVRELFHFAQGLINGSKQIFPGVDISLAVQNLLSSTQIQSLFEPYCDDYGQFAYKGCEYSVPTLASKVCYCTSEDLQQVGDATSYVEPPQRCPMGPDQCPMAWGPKCEKPDWWCTHEKKCRKGHEKCYSAVECDDEECSKMPKISCVPKELRLPCEPQPCKDNKYKMCPPCGEEATCFHISRGGFNSEGSYDDDSDSGEKDDDDESEDKDDDSDSEDKGDDDDDSDEKGDKYDDNDSDEKHAAAGKLQDDDDSDEDFMSWMRPPKGQNYICECPTGRSGPNCEVHDEICKSIPPQLCRHGCMGDLERGVLCRCPEGYAGVTCEKVAHTPCEIMQAFNGDSLNIVRGLFEIPGYDGNELKQLVRFLVKLTGGDSIMETKCTENGFFQKIQCLVNVFDMDIVNCYCADHRGEYIASNIMPYIGYDVCTGPMDMRAFVGLCLRQDLQVCQNGGSCVFDLYEGKICSCPPGFHGQFCEKQGQPEEESISFCDFMEDAFYYVQDLMRRNGTMHGKLVSYHYEIMASFISLNSNRSTKGYDSSLYALKMECKPDGHFKPYACDYDLMTDQRLACYCLGKDGPLIGTEAPDPESLDCSDLSELVCHELEGCPYLECEHGHRYNLQYCPICECRQPCEGYKCQRGEKCVVKEYECDKRDGKCTMPMCVPMHKPGVCPGHKPDHLSSIQEKLNSFIGDVDTCQVKCYDDADCEGSKKCCGLCGTKCVEPERSEDCTEQYDIMMEYLEFIRESRNVSIPVGTPRSMFKTLDEADRVHEIWIPSCMDSNYVPVQCMYNVSALLLDTSMITECFCVDHLGQHIKGSVGYYGNDSSCDVKPHSCPLLHPSTDEDAMDECMGDRYCLSNSKCCYDGFHYVCTKPVPEPPEDYPMNMIMDSICKTSKDICSSGPCMSKWKMEGKVCECGDYTTGPFCDIPVGGEVVKPRTACERKRLTTYLFWMSMGKILTTETSVQNYSKIDHVVSSAVEMLLADVPVHQHEKIPIIMYECDEEDGGYAPVQCDLSMFTEKAMECFCVDEEGQELPGTRKPADKPLTYCNRERHCDMGHALLGPDGDLVLCDKDNRCPYGYSCARGLYGYLYCCPNEEEKKDICNHPLDPGYQCEDGDPAVSYYYRADTDSCESFNYMGCAGNRNRFESMNDCIMRCKDQIHLGSCPSRPVEVTKARDCDQNECEFDADCPSDRLKCCNSTCGMRCIPAIDESPAEGHCPVGLRKSEPEMCLYDYQCGSGFKCHFEGNELTDVFNSGFCCLDVQNINYCQVKPFALMMEKMMKDDSSDEDKYDSDEDKYDSDEDKDESSDEDKEDRWGEPGKRGMACEKMMPRFYFNHEQSQCEMYYGCPEDFNTFKTRDDCCKTCSNERRCREGKCPSPKSDIAVTCTDMCVYDHECPGGKICCNTGCSMNCVDPQGDMNATCRAEQKEAKKSMSLNPRGDDCHSVYIPMCEANGQYAKQQCHTSRGVCWCVTPYGNYLNGSITRGVARCHRYSETDMFFADSHPVSVHTVPFEVCPYNQKIHCCSETLCEKRCPAHPEAMCRINPCGGCRAEYFDADNQIVNCAQDRTLCQKELHDASNVIKARSITANREEEEDEDKEEKRREMVEEQFNDWGMAVRSDIPAKCQKAPETGNCKGFVRRWYYNPQTKTCNMFIWGMCGGNENRFQSPEECYDECDPKSDPCNAVRCGIPKPECILTYDEDCYSFEEGCNVSAECTEGETNANLVDGVFIPRCLSTGAYIYKQCHGRYCWCVDENGDYAGGLTSTSNAYYGDLQCTSSGPTPGSVVNLPDCPEGSYAEKPQHDCLRECNHRVCPGHPKAECVVDLCSESCETKFVNERGVTVDCEEDDCKAFSFDYRDHCGEGVLCDGGTAKNCRSDICQGARQRLCPKNPCAVCMVDSCTCEPYFVDVLTSQEVDVDSEGCKFLTTGSCTAQKCQLMIDNAPQDQLPQCTGGSFAAKQCQESYCYCVDAEGNSVGNVSRDGDCEEIDEIGKIELKLVFDGDFDLLERQGKLPKVKEAVRNTLIYDIGVPEVNIKYISDPYKGSVIVDTVIQDKKDDPNNGNINLLANTISQKIQNNDFTLDVDGQELRLQEDETTFVTVPESLVEYDDGDDDGLSDKEIIIISSCAGGVGLLVLVAAICCCCCRKKKEPHVVDDTYDHIRERRESDKNVYDNPVTMYNNKSFEAEGHYMDVQDPERYMKVRL